MTAAPDIARARPWRTRHTHAAVHVEQRIERIELEVWRPAFGGGEGLLPVDYGCAELVRRVPATSGAAGEAA